MDGTLHPDLTGGLLEKPASVRVATPADAERLFWHLMVHLQADNAMFEAAPKKVFDVVQRCCSGELGIAGIIETPDGEIIGSTGICAIPATWYSDAWMLAEVWLFVRPDYRRGSRHADDLFAFGAWHRQDMEARIGGRLVLQTNVTSQKRLDAKIRLWRRKGRQIGATFWVEGDR